MLLWKQYLDRRRTGQSRSKRNREHTGRSVESVASFHSNGSNSIASSTTSPTKIRNMVIVTTYSTEEAKKSHKVVLLNQLLNFIAMEATVLLLSIFWILCSGQDKSGDTINSSKKLCSNRGCYDIVSAIRVQLLIKGWSYYKLYTYIIPWYACETMR